MSKYVILFTEAVRGMLVVEITCSNLGYETNSRRREQVLARLSEISQRKCVLALYSKK
jgi:hypothetical protein